MGQWEMVLTLKAHLHRQMDRLPVHHKLRPSCFCRQERGSVVVLVALCLTALLGFCAMVTDVGLLYVEKSHLQNAVDAAALAGVQDLPDNTTLAQQVACDNANKNGVPTVNVTFESSNAIIVVNATKQVPTYFARILGISEGTISVSAKAMMVPPSGLSAIAPLSIQEQDLHYGQKYVLKSGGGSGTTSWYFDDDKNNSVQKSNQIGSSGWYGALELTSTGANTFESDLENGYQGVLSVGQIINVKHGNMSGPTATGINNRLSHDTRVPRNSITDYDRDAPEIIYIPIVQIVNASGNSIQSVKVVGFAAFFIEGVAGNGNNSIVSGWFIRTLVPNTLTKESVTDINNTVYDMEHGGSSTDFGLYSPKLIGN